MLEGGTYTVTLGVLLFLSVFFNLLLFYISSELTEELRELKYGTRMSHEELEVIRQRLTRFKQV